MGEPIFTVANQLTLLRMALVPVLVVLVLSHQLVWAAVVFVVAAATDLLDGWIARHGHQQTTLGAVLDPLADKMLMAAGVVVLTWGPELTAPLPAWLTVTVLSRDAMLIVSVVAVNLFLGRRVFYPTRLGKLHTLVISVMLGVTLLANALGERWSLLRYLYVVVVGLAVASAAQYAYLGSVDKGSAPASSG
jgi:cardiolipin synthase